MSTCEMLTTDAPLLHAYHRMVEVLDADHRAWIVGLGRVVGTSIDAPSPDLRTVLTDAVTQGEFPTGPFCLHLSDLIIHGSHDLVTARADVMLPGGRRLEYRIAGAPRTLAVALTRNGHLDDGTCVPAHVQLADAESVLVDTTTLTRRLASTIGHCGLCHVALGIVSHIPNQPLELRVYDEDSGDRLRPPAGYDEFDPVFREFRADCTQTDMDIWLWDTSLSIAAQFGVFEPQMVRHPESASRPGWRVGPI